MSIWDEWRQLDRFGRLVAVLPVAMVVIGAVVYGFELLWECRADPANLEEIRMCSEIRRNDGLMIGGIFASVVAAVALFLNWQRTKTDRDKYDTDRRRMVNDTYVKAVEQLGHKKMEVRLGAIYALERIAAADRDYHWPIMETLCAYIRERPASKWKKEPGSAEEGEAGSARSETPRAEEGAGEMGDVPPGNGVEMAESATPERKRPPTDIQAILTVFERRSYRRKAWEKANCLRLDLRHADLRGAEVTGIVIHRADLTNANLRCADLRGANLEDAKLWGANLEDADLRHAALACANLMNANLWRALLVKADLRGADLGGAFLGRAHLGGADLRDADLVGADLKRAFIADAKLKGVNLMGADLTDADLRDAIFSNDPSELGAVWDRAFPPRNLDKIIVDTAVS